MNYKESITALLEGLKGIFENKTATEASAIAQASSKPSTIFYTSDTHAIVVGGQVYGRSNQVSADAPFAYLPADVSSPAADPQFDVNHDTIYIQPIKTGADAGKIKLWWYVNGAWTSTDTLDLVLPTDAEDITYDLTNTPDLGSGDVQSAIEALDGKVEELRDEVLGDEWVDEIHGRRFLSLGSEYGWYRNYSILRKHSTLDGDWNANVIGFKVKAGDKFRLVGISTNKYNNWNTSPMACFYDVYEVPTASGSSPSSYTFPNAQYVGSYSPEFNRPIDDIVEIPQGVEMVVFRATKNGVVSSGGYLWYASDDKSSCYRYLGNVLSIADKTGYKIDTWTDDEIITSTTLAVGSVVPYWADGTRYGSRGVRLNVKEGDKVLLDTYSPALFGLIFTDENRVVKALYDDRRFDGVWTAPCDGYCYIQDVLYRDNFHYSSAHGHLAYMAHDARKRVAKGGDWYNEYAPRILGDCLCEFNIANASSAIRYMASLDRSQVGSQTLLTSRNANKFTLHASYIKIFADNEASGVVNNHSWGANNAAVNNIKGLSLIAGEETEGWAVAITRATADYTNAYYGAYFSLSKKANLHAQCIKTFLHSSYDFGELYALAQKIANGEVEVDNFYGVREKEVDLVRNAIGLQSISDLGYNILEHGATLPIDEEGYKYGISEKARQDAYSGVYFYTGNEDLVYMPSIDFTKIKNSLYKFCEDAHNLITIPDIVAEGKVISLSYAFRNCWSLKSVGDIKIIVNNLGRTFENCYALEYIGRIATIDDNNIRVSEKTSLFGNCYSLERVEELNMYRWGGNNFNATTFNNCVNLRYLLIKGFGSWDKTGMGLQNVLANWGIPNDKHTDARQSLVDSLLTYSYDRVNDPDGLGTAGTTCTITLSANTYAQLTASEIEAITAKGYTLTHP